MAERYSDILPERFYHSAGCENLRGVAALKQRVGELATELDLVPQQWPAKYELIDSAIASAASGRPYLSRIDFNKILDNCGIQPSQLNFVARIFGDLGIITHFPDREELRDFIVLQPQWLTRAISLVLESPELEDNRGEIEKSFIHDLWDEEYPGMFVQFYNCMKQFELCYELEQRPSNVLVPLRFGNRSHIPSWDNSATSKERRIEYRFDLRPPAGLMSRFIVKTHHMISRSDERGTYWRNGVFLETGAGQLRSQALGTWDEDRRIFRIVVRSILPQAMLDQLDGFAQAVFAFFQGMEAKRHYGCIYEDGTPCPAYHEAKQIAYSLELDDSPIVCAEGKHRVRPSHLITGLNSFSQPPEIEEIMRRVMRQELRPVRSDLGTLVRGIDGLGQSIANLEDSVEHLRRDGKQLPADIGLRIEQTHALLLSAFVAERQQQIPRIFLILPEGASRFDPTNWFSKKYTLNLYCEHEHPHPGIGASFAFSQTRDWWRRSAPLIGLVFRYIRLTTGPGVAALRVMLGKDDYSLVEAGAQLMKDLVNVLPEVSSADGLTWPGAGGTSDEEAEMLRARAAVADLVRKLDPNGFQAHAIGELRRYATRDNSYRWLCAQHAAEYGLG